MEAFQPRLQNHKPHTNSPPSPCCMAAGRVEFPLGLACVDAAAGLPGCQQMVPPDLHDNGDTLDTRSLESALSSDNRRHAQLAILSFSSPSVSLSPSPSVSDTVSLSLPLPPTLLLSLSVSVSHLSLSLFFSSNISSKFCLCLLVFFHLLSHMPLFLSLSLSPPPFYVFFPSVFVAFLFECMCSFLVYTLTPHPHPPFLAVCCKHGRHFTLF